MGKNKKAKVYDSEALKSLGEYLEKVRKEGNNKVANSQVKLEGLQNAIMLLPKEDRENIEKFWGLTGGPNHSKKMTRPSIKDVAYVQMMRKAVGSSVQLMKLDFVVMYDDSIQELVQSIIPKINKKGIEEMTDFECVKYLVTFLVLVENGPKMSFEQNLMSIETKVDPIYHLNEYQALIELCGQMKDFPDKSINLGLVKGVFEMWDFKDCMSIQKSFGIQFDKDIRLNEAEILNTFGQIRAFKERVFEYGPWDVTCQLAMGYDVELNEFMKAIQMLHRDWSKIADFKVSQMSLRTSKEIRTLNVYSIGGLEFTDPYEVMFLYLERNCIAA